MRVFNFYWLFLLVPTAVKWIWAYNGFKMDHGSWRGLTYMETICVLAFFVSIGFWLGHELSKDDSKTFDLLQMNYRKELKEHYEKLREVSLSIEKENSHLKALIESQKSDGQQKERLIYFLKESLSEEKVRNRRTAEEANKEALEAIS